MKKKNRPKGSPKAKAPAKPSWFARHPLLVIGLVLAAALGPFLNQAIQTDDTLFVWTAQHIQKHPLDFFGFKVNWWGSAIPMWMANYNPPLLPYLLAVAGSLFGWQEIVLHLACLGVTFAAAAGIYALARQWCDRPLLAVLIAITMPAFFVLSTTLMCDVLMLACWTWAVVFWERAATDGKGRWLYILAGLLAGQALISKYSAVTMLPLLPILSLPHIRKPGWGWVGLAIPVAMLAGYNGLTAHMYGTGLFTLASRYAHAHQFGFPGGWQAKGIIGLAFTGGSLLPFLFFAPWLWRWRSWLAGGAIILGALWGWFWLKGNPGLLHPWTDPGNYLCSLWDFKLQIVLMAAAGLNLLLVAGVEAWQRRDRITLTLVCWIGGICFFATVLNWTVNARSFLPAVPAVAILMVRRLTALRPPGRQRLWLALPLVASAVVVMGLAVSNYQLANSARAAAAQIADAKEPGHNLWFNGHSGFQYYMEKIGGRPLDVQDSWLQRGDIIAVAMLGSLVVMPAESIGVIKNVNLRLPTWFNLEQGSVRSAAGFYTSDDGPVPFARDTLPTQEFMIVKVFSSLRFTAQVSNPTNFAAGELPDFQHKSCYMDKDVPPPQDPAAEQQIQQAHQLEDSGNPAAAVASFRAALNIQSNNPVAMNQLAWILATCREPSIRDSKSAVQLAGQAVQLTDWRRASMVGTLATAYAADGDYERASIVAEFARNLGIVTGQQEVVEASTALLRQCAALLTSSPPKQ
jgi:4-amino-4-deoxy-L-arabinose transferase-like glycosyltransferase